MYYIYIRDTTVTYRCLFLFRAIDSLQNELLIYILLDIYLITINMIGFNLNVYLIQRVLSIVKTYTIECYIKVFFNVTS